MQRTEGSAFVAMMTLFWMLAAALMATFVAFSLAVCFGLTEFGSCVKHACILEFGNYNVSVYYLQEFWGQICIRIRCS